MVEKYLSKDIYVASVFLVPRQALRNSIYRVDGSEVAMCSTSTIRRRIYSVPYPNFVWHVDGHHKLIRWGFVVHGAIDGFS